MTYKLIEARYVRGHIIHFKFDDGVEGDVDLEGELEGPIFEPLRDPKAFMGFSLDRELHTIVWGNGADLAPEFLHERLLSTAAREKRPPYQ